MHSKPSVSVVLTSCDRFDLLEKTLFSFFENNTYPISQFIIIEDSGRKKSLLKVLSKFKSFDFIVLVNESKLGQLGSIDKAYSHVTSEYIYHCEEDWLFLRKGFIEESLEVLESEPDVLSVWTRDINELSALDFSDVVYSTASGLKYKLVFNQILSFNPSLIRVKDYALLSKGYSAFEGKGFEIKISDFFQNIGYKSSVLLEPCVAHIGWHRRVPNIHKKHGAFVLFLLGRSKYIKARFYRRFSLKRFNRK